MMEIAFELNGEARRMDVDPEMPLLWLLRDVLGLTGAKYGCGIGACGACTVHLDGEAVRACTTPMSVVAGRQVTTIERFSENFSHPLLQAWIIEDVPQCGYCQTGQIMAAAALLTRTPHPSDAEIDAAMAENICRCGTYQRIRAAIHWAARLEQSNSWSDIGHDTMRPPTTESCVRLNPWIKIGADNRVTILISKAEMGQGVRTALAMLVAEELEVNWAQVQVEQAPVDAVYAQTPLEAGYGVQATVGSASIEQLWEPLRAVGASARTRLLAAAAQLWHVDVSECRAEAGTVIHEPSQRRLAYSEVAESAATLPEPAKISLKSATEFKLIGQSIPRIDNPQVVSGVAQFGQDVRVPGMLYAVVARCPIVGGQLAEFDATAAKAVPGVKAVILIDNGVAVVGETTWAALAGRDALKLVWNEGPNGQLNNAHLYEELQRVLDPSQPMPSDDLMVIEATYELPMLAHAPMEPMNCVADVRAARCDIWVGSQMPAQAQIIAAQALDLAVDAVTINQTLLGGAFGLKADTIAVSEAVQISKQVGAPVQIVWSRSDDVKHNRYRPPSLHTLRSAVDSDKRILAWSHALATDGLLDMFSAQGAQAGAERAAKHPYDIPNSTVEVAIVNLPVPTWPWRSVFLSQTVFANESFMDELAHALQRDPYELRREHIRSSRLRHVLELVADKAHWGEPLPADMGRGIACCERIGSFIATVVELAVDGAKVRVRRVVCAVDCGIAVNPSTIEAQIQGAVVDGLATALKAEVTIDQGRIQQSNFLDFEWLRMGEMPRIEVHLVPSHEDPTGVGELGYPPVPAAVANAIFAATGKRVRRLPIRL